MFSRLCIWLTTLCFILQSFAATPLYAAIESSLPVFSTLPVLKGLRLLPSNDLKMEFLFEQNDVKPNRADLEKVVRLFMTGLTLNAKEIWVNLSPYEPDRIMSPLLALTELGKGMAQQDYLLKQRASGLTNPNKEVGSQFWKSVLTTNPSADFRPKVWIVPDQAVVYHLGNSALLGKMHLRVLAEADYLAVKKVNGASLIAQDVSTKIMREVICPVLEKEVNESAEFAPLRQMYQALVLAHWFKTYHGKTLPPDYIEQSKIKGVDVVGKEQIQTIYEEYKLAYKKGAYNFIREDMDLKGNIVPRKYFSGGLTFDTSMVSFIKTDGWQRIKESFQSLKLTGALVVFMALLATTSNVQAASSTNLEDIAVQKKILTTQFHRMEMKAHQYTTKMQALNEQERTLKKQILNTASKLSSNQNVITPGLKLHPEKLVESVNIPSKISKGRVLPKPEVVKSVDLKPEKSKSKHQEVKSKTTVPEHPKPGRGVKTNNNLSKTQPTVEPNIFPHTTQTLSKMTKPSPVKTNLDTLETKPNIITNAPTLKPEINLTNLVPINMTGTFAQANLNNVDDSLPPINLPPINLSLPGAGSGGGPPPDDPWTKLINNGNPSTPVGITNTITTSSSPFVNLSFRGEIGYLTGSPSGVFSQTDIQIDRLMGSGFSTYGGLRLNVMPQMEEISLMPQEISPMSTSNMNNKYEIVWSPYIGFHKAIGFYEYFAELQDFRNVHLGIESRPVYYKGVSYTYGISGLAYETPEGYQYGAIADGYLSMPLSKLGLSDRNWLDKTYLSFTAKIAAMQEGLGVGGAVRLSYDNQWEVFAEVSPFRDLPDAQKAIGHHDDPNNFSMGFGHRLNSNSTLYFKWVEPLGDSSGFDPRFFMGINFELGRRGVNHSDPRKSPDFFRFPKIWNIRPDGSMLVNRRSFLYITVLGIFGVAGGVFAQDSNDPKQNRYQDVLKTPSDPICGEPISILTVGKDTLRESHMVYFAFMYWYLNDKDNEWIQYSHSKKEEFLKMSPWQWEDFLKERLVTQRHSDLVDIVQTKLKAEVYQSAGEKAASKPEFKIDGDVFRGSFRDWVDRYITYLRKNVDYLGLKSVRKQGLISLINDYPRILNLLLAKQNNLIKEFLKTFVNLDDVIAVMKEKGQNISVVVKKNLTEQWDQFFINNPEWIMLAAQRKLNSQGFKVPIDGTLNSETAKVIRTLIEKGKDSAQIITPGGIDFVNLAETTKIKAIASSYNKISHNSLIGMTFKILEVRVWDISNFYLD